MMLLNATMPKVENHHPNVEGTEIILKDDERKELISAAVKSADDRDSLNASDNVFSKSKQPDRVKENPGSKDVRPLRDLKIIKCYNDLLERKCNIVNPCQTRKLLK